LSKSPRARANDDDSDTRIEIGFKIAPVPLNLEGKDRDMVGLGSYRQRDRRLQWLPQQWLSSTWHLSLRYGQQPVL
jgi:hypothetical protein